LLLTFQDGDDPSFNTQVKYYGKLENNDGTHIKETSCTVTSALGLSSLFRTFRFLSVGLHPPHLILVVETARRAL
jgi:hypothetical protein